MAMVSTFSLILGCNSSKNIEGNNLETKNHYFNSKLNKSSLSLGMTLQLNDGIVNLYEPLYDTNSNGIITPYLLYYDSDSYVERYLVVRSYYRDGNVSEAKILDSDMSDLITFSVRDDAIDTNTIYIYEYDLEDTLIITRTLLNDSLIYEKYRLNGESYDLEYTVDELNKFIITCCNKENNNFAANGINDDSNSNFSKFLKFDEFYKDDISLNNNVDGNILTEIVTDVDFQNWFNSKTAPFKATNEKELRISREKACAIASVTSLLKCTFGGGLANFICIAATGTSLVCAVATIVG